MNLFETIILLFLGIGEYSVTIYLGNIEQWQLAAKLYIALECNCHNTTATVYIRGRQWFISAFDIPASYSTIMYTLRTMLARTKDLRVIVEVKPLLRNYFN